jgi:hypothetical protein
MLMPKASVDEHNLSARRKNYIGCSRQVSAVDPKSIAQFMGDSADKDFRLAAGFANV